MSTESQSGAPTMPAVNPPAELANQQPTPPDSQLDSRLAALTRREREIQQQRQAFAQEKAGLVSKSELAKLWKEDRNKVRELLGIPETEWEVQPSAPKSPEDPIKSLREEIENLKREKQSEQQNKAISEFKRNLGDFIRQDPDNYELISAYDAIDSVYEYMVDYYKENNGSMISPKEACDHVENYLFEQLKQGTSTKKIGSLFQQSQTPGKQPSPTLTGTTAANPTTNVQRKLSPEESIAEAAKLIKWT